MDTQLALICFLTFVIHLIGTLAYSVPLTGIRTRLFAAGAFQGSSNTENVRLF
jgi:hypothetical protein